MATAVVEEEATVAAARTAEDAITCLTKKKTWVADVVTVTVIEAGTEIEMTEVAATEAETTLRAATTMRSLSIGTSRPRRK